MMKAKSILLIILVSMFLVILAGCKTESESEVIYQSNYVKIVQESNKTTVSDILDNRDYSYKAVRVRRTDSDSDTEAYTSVDTDNLKIEMHPSAILHVYDKNAGEMVVVKQSARK